jgi:hypothetical protein
VTPSLPLPAALPLDHASWEQTPLVVRQAVIYLLAVIQQQQERIAALEARQSQNSRTSDRPPSSDPPYAKRIPRSGARERPGAKPGHPGHSQVLLEPTQVIEVQPGACPCGQREFPETTSYYTHQVIELPPIQMQVKPRHNRLYWLSQKRAEKPSCTECMKAREIAYMPLVTLALMASEIDHRDLTNRVTTDTDVKITDSPGFSGKISSH